MYKMFLRPDADGYSSTDGTEWIMSQLDGGIGRYRKDKEGASKAVNVKWTLNRANYQYWRAFYAVVKSSTFLCDLVSEDGTGPAEHQCNIIPGSVSMPTQIGFTYVQTAQLEVKPLRRNMADDIALISIFNNAEGEPDLWYEALERLANVTLPNAETFDA